jgi:hypothetical protein
MTEYKIYTEKEKLLIGNHFHILEDNSMPSFRTTDIKAFREYLSTCLNNDFFGDFSIYYTEKCLEAFFNPPHNRRHDALAVCGIQYAEPVNILLTSSNKNMHPEDFEMFLKRMRPYFADEHGSALLDHVKDIQLQKELSFRRKKERNGNYYYSIKAENAFCDDFHPPETIKFIVPIVEHIESEEEFEFDFEFSFKVKESDDTLQLFYQINCIDLKEYLRKKIKDLVEEELEKTTVQKYWGNYKISANTDAWKYMENPKTGI